MTKLPQPPINLTNESLKRSINDVVSFLREIYEKGLKYPGFSQAQIDSFTQTSFLGTLLFNTDTNEANVAYLDNDVVKWRAI